MRNNMLERIKTIILETGISPRAFAIRVDFNYSTLNNYLSGRRSTIDSELIVKILSSFDNISAEWLLRGKGEMIKENTCLDEQSFSKEQITNERLLHIIESQQRTIESMQEQHKKMLAQMENNATCANVSGYELGK